ncbi:unnamed protein product [Urochloa decumbens]|uniref:Uncharacterized protein n=1 Tax=Urochloa decumbens TaxID=240449 RepID=A0ABC9B6K0_9POAL
MQLADLVAVPRRCRALPVEIESSMPMPCRSCGCGCAGGDAHREENLCSPLLLDLERGRLPIAPPPGAVTKAAKAAHDRSHPTIAKCFIRGLFALLWVFLADLLRRFLVTYCDEPSLLFIISPLSLFAIAVTLVLFTLMDCGEECFPSLKEPRGPSILQNVS